MKNPVLLVAALFVGTAAAALAQTPASAPGPLTYSQPLNPAAIGIVQDKLKQQGGYTGAADGNWSAESEAALSRFQQTHGLQTTGQINQATALLLGIEPSDLIRQSQPLAVAPPTSASAPAVPLPTASAASVPAAPVPPEVGTRLSPVAVRNLQSRLAQLGYYSGGIDGQWGPSSEAAITRFQQASNIPSNGRINPQTVAAMGLDTNNLEAPAK